MPPVSMSKKRNEAAKAEIRKRLVQQATAWNEGNRFCFKILDYFLVCHTVFITFAANFFSSKQIDDKRNLTG